MEVLHPLQVEDAFTVEHAGQVTVQAAVLPLIHQIALSMSSAILIFQQGTQLATQSRAETVSMGPSKSLLSSRAVAWTCPCELHDLSSSWKSCRASCEPVQRWLNLMRARVTRMLMAMEMTNVRMIIHSKMGVTNRTTPARCKRGCSCCKQSWKACARKGSPSGVMRLSFSNTCKA